MTLVGFGSDLNTEIAGRDRLPVFRLGKPGAVRVLRSCRRVRGESQDRGQTRPGLCLGPGQPGTTSNASRIKRCDRNSPYCFS